METDDEGEGGGFVSGRFNWGVATRVPPGRRVRVDHARRRKSHRRESERLLLDWTDERTSRIRTLSRTFVKLKEKGTRFIFTQRGRRIAGTANDRTEFREKQKMHRQSNRRGRSRRSLPRVSDQSGNRMRIVKVNNRIHSTWNYIFNRHLPLSAVISSQRSQIALLFRHLHVYSDTVDVSRQHTLDHGRTLE